MTLWTGGAFLVVKRWLEALIFVVVGLLAMFKLIELLRSAFDRLTSLTLRNIAKMLGNGV